MYIFTKNIFFISAFISLSALFSSCKEEFKSDDFTAYFQGEIINPQDDCLILFKDNIAIDTLYLDENNKFFKKYDCLEPGMYVYKHNPEYQNVYFDKNDSLYMRLNSYNFNNSIIFLGRGGEKNNFLMDLNDMNNDDKLKMDPEYNDDIETFIRKIDSAHAERNKFYLRKKSEIKWNDDFDLYAKNMLDLHYYLKKELYPLAHNTVDGIKEDLPKNYYDFRKKVDFNNEKLNYFYPFTRYLNIMITSIANNNSYTYNLNLDKQIDKLNIVDTLIQNPKVKNTVLNNLAFIYLLDDKNINSDTLFMKRYFELSTDKSQQNEIIQIQESIKTLQEQKTLPEVGLINTKDEVVSINDIINKETIIYVWSKLSPFHFNSARKKALEITDKYPDISIICINLDQGQEEWKNMIINYSNPKITDLRALDFSEIKDKWVINKVYRTLYINADCSINNAFVNLFDDTLLQKNHTVKKASN